MSGDVLLSVRDLEKRYPAPGRPGRRPGRRWLRGWPGRQGRIGSDDGPGAPDRDGKRDGIAAVAGVSFDVLRGETLGLVGESGSGKTTIARTVLRLVEPSAGRVVFDGQDVGALKGRALRDFRCRAQIVFQDPWSSLNPRMRVGTALGEVLRVHGLSGDGADRRRRVAALLERVGLRPGHADALPHELSGGERQRVGIARALAVEPELLVLDEPVSALDVSVRAQVVNLLRDLQADLGLTYLFIAHDLALVEHLADRVAVLYLGRIVETAPAEVLYREPRHPYTRALLSAAEVAGRSRGDAHARLLPGEPPDPGHPPPGCPLHPRCPHPERDARCARAVPPLEPRAPGHAVACIKEPGGTVTGR